MQRRAAFDALTEAQQALVSKEAQDKLAACEARIAELEKPDEARRTCRLPT